MKTIKVLEQTSEVAGMDLKNDGFSYGQLYIACSCVSSSGSLKKETKVTYTRRYLQKKKNVED